jgi:hypothetical protein
MANTFNASLMPRILAGALKVLREETVLARKCTKDISSAAGELGQTVSIAVPSAQASYAITPAATAPALVDASFVARTVTVDQFRGSRFHLSATDMANYNLGNSEIVPNQIAEAARKLARDLNQAIVAKYTSIAGWAGDVTTNLFASSVNGLAAVDARLNYQLCPPESRVLITTLAGRSLALQLDDVKKNPQLAGDQEAYRRASLGMIYGMDVYHDRDIPTHAAGSGTIFSAAYINTAAAIGASTIVVRAATGGSITMKAGDIFTTSGDTTIYYTTTADLTVAAGATDTLTLDRPLEAAITINETLAVPTGFASGVNYLAGDLAGIGLVMRVPAAGGSIEGAPTLGPSMAMVDEFTGMPVKLTYLPGYHAAQWELSILYGAGVIDGRRLVRVGSLS